MPLLYHAYVYLEFLILACTIYILAPGQYPSFDLFVKLITMFDISVDQFIHADGGARSSSCRKHIDVLLNSMNEKELVVIEATAEGIEKARETKVPE